MATGSSTCTRSSPRRPASGPGSTSGARWSASTFYDDGWKLPDGTEYRQGSATCGDKPANVAVYRWKVDDARVPAEVFD